MTPKDEVEIRCLLFSAKTIPVVISPQVALHKTFPEVASNKISYLSVLAAAMTYPYSSTITFIKSGTYFLF